MCGGATAAPSLSLSLSPCAGSGGCPGSAPHRRGSHRPQGQRGAARAPALPGLNPPPGLHPLRPCTDTPSGAQSLRLGSGGACGATPRTPRLSHPLTRPGRRAPAGWGGWKPVLSAGAAAHPADRPSPTALPVSSRTSPLWALFRAQFSWLHRAGSSARARWVGKIPTAGAALRSPLPLPSLVPSPVTEAALSALRKFPAMA